MATWAGFWSGSGSYSLLTNKPHTKAKIARLLRPQGMRALRRKMIALNGAAAGGSVTGDTYKRVKGEVAQPTAIGALGGSRTIETVDTVTAVTSAADESLIDTIIDNDFAPTYARDLSGNGAR